MLQELVTNLSSSILAFPSQKCACPMGGQCLAVSVVQEHSAYQPDTVDLDALPLQHSVQVSNTVVFLSTC